MQAANLASVAPLGRSYAGHTYVFFLSALAIFETIFDKRPKATCFYAHLDDLARFYHIWVLIENLMLQSIRRRHRRSSVALWLRGLT